MKNAQTSRSPLTKARFVPQRSPVPRNRPDWIDLRPSPCACARAIASSKGVTMDNGIAECLAPKSVLGPMNFVYILKQIQRTQ